MSQYAFLKTDLPPIIDFKQLQANFQISRTTAYKLISENEIISLTQGAPGKRGHRVILTSSVFDYIARRIEQSVKPNC